MGRRQQSPPSKDDSFPVVWRRRLSLFYDSVLLMATSNRYGQRAALEHSLGRRLALCPEAKAEWALANLDHSALTPREKEWAVEQKKDLRCVSIGMGISYFCFVEFGLFPALAGIGWVLDNKIEPIPFALYMKKRKKFPTLA